MSETKVQNVEKKLNVYQKLQKCRVELQKEKLKKSGENKFSHYTYYELGDFLPQINVLMDKYNLIGIFSYGDTESKLEIIDTDNPEDLIIFTTTVSVAELKGCHMIQSIGATQTYARRYLYTMAFEIAESDILDSEEIDEGTIIKEQKIDVIKANTIKEMIKKTNSNEKVFLEYYKIKKVEDITNGLFVKVMNTLQDKLEKQEKEKDPDLGI